MNDSQQSALANFVSAENYVPPELDSLPIFKNPCLSRKPLNNGAAVNVERIYQLCKSDPNDGERTAWCHDWLSFMQNKGTPVQFLPKVNKIVLDLYKLYNLVVGYGGGFLETTKNGLWYQIVGKLGISPIKPKTAYRLRMTYERFLFQYECHNKKIVKSKGIEALQNSSEVVSIATRKEVVQGLTIEDNNFISPMSTLQNPLFSECYTRFQCSAERGVQENGESFQTNQYHNAPSNVCDQIIVSCPNKSTLLSLNDRESMASSTIPSCAKSLTTNMKLTCQDDKMYVSMEVNGKMYQGILYETPNVTFNQFRRSSPVFNFESSD